MLCHIVPISGGNGLIDSFRLLVHLGMTRRNHQTFRSQKGEKRLEELTEELRSVVC